MSPHIEALQSTLLAVGAGLSLLIVVASAAERLGVNRAND